MNLREVAWMRAARPRLERQLRRQLLALHRMPRWLPAFARRPVLAWRYRFRRIPVIVQTAGHCQGEDRDRLCGWLRSRGCRQVRRLDLVGCVAAEMPVAAVSHVAQRSEVERLFFDREVRALLDVAAPAVGASALHEAGLTGQGVTVAVLDTGIHPHPDFLEPSPRLEAFHDAVNGRTDFYDDHGHGTHVAGIIAGNGTRSGGRFKGIAPGARLAGVKVLDGRGSGRMSTVIAGVEWVVQNRERLGIRVLNVSLGAPASSSYQDDPLARACAAAWEQGIVVCVAAGNEGPAPRTIASPGFHPAVLTVGASDDRTTPERGDDTVADFSSRGPTVDGLSKPDVVAPGVEITAVNAPGSLLDRQSGRGADYITLSGTSMATPVVAGLAALLLERNPDLRPDDVKRLLMETATDLGADVNAQGRGLVDGPRALEAAAGREEACPGS
ncbi:MAG TPA: S8 family peptidase [Thermaerobacter sp.]